MGASINTISTGVKMMHANIPIRYHPKYRPTLNKIPFALERRSIGRDVVIPFAPFSPPRSLCLPESTFQHEFRNYFCRKNLNTCRHEPRASSLEPKIHAATRAQSLCRIHQRSPTPSSKSRRLERKSTWLAKPGSPRRNYVPERICNDC
jgi:hypothetical protein